MLYEQNLCKIMYILKIKFFTQNNLPNDLSKFSYTYSESIYMRAYTYIYSLKNISYYSHTNYVTILPKLLLSM